MNEAEVLRELIDAGFDVESTKLALFSGWYVYCLFGDDDELFYVGYSTGLLARLGTHVRQHKRLKIAIVTECSSEREARLLERLLIRQCQPRKNVLGTEKFANWTVSGKSVPKVE